MDTIFKYKRHLEVGMHTLFWLFILASINIHWNNNWFLTSIDTKSVPPLSLLLFAFYFYINSFYLLPNYFSRKHWKLYFTYAVIIFVSPELLRIFVYKMFVFDKPVMDLVYHRDSFIFGSPSPLILAVNASIAYRLISDRLFSNTKPTLIPKTSDPFTPLKDTLQTEEIELLQKRISEQLEEADFFLLAKVGISELAQCVNSSEKKVSYVINHCMRSSFPELLNHHRIERFKAEVALDKNQHLSIVGIATNCGFSSKSSFYRAFKSQVGMTPSQYIKSLN